MKQIVQVLEAVEAGCATCHEVAEKTGLPKKIASAYLTKLREDGAIQVTGSLPPKHGPFRINCYVAAKG